MDKNTNNALVILSKHHEEYIKMAKALANNNFEVRNYAEDFVQEAYLRLSRYVDLFDKVVSKNGKAAKGYMFFTLRSIIVNRVRKKSNLDFSFLGSQYDFEEKYNWVDEGVDPKIIGYQELEDKMYDVLKENTKWFDYELFRKYLKDGKSFRTMAEESGIGIRTIYLSIKRSKIVIANAMEEHYMDYINGDYDKI